MEETRATKGSSLALAGTLPSGCGAVLQAWRWHCSVQAIIGAVLSRLGPYQSVQYSTVRPVDWDTYMEMVHCASGL